MPLDVWWEGTDSQALPLRRLARARVPEDSKVGDPQETHSLCFSRHVGGHYRGREYVFICHTTTALLTSAFSAGRLEYYVI